MTENHKILDLFPKNRVDLPQAYQDIYAKHYLINREGKSKTTSLSQKLERWLHKQVAKDVVHGVAKSTLEIGAGTLNQVDYEPKVGPYDIIEPFKELFEGSPKLSHIDQVYDDISEVEVNEYDRITSVAVFEHIMDLPYVVAKSALLLKQDGCIRTAIPNEGTFMWKLGTKVTGREFKKKYGLDYQTLMTYEHVNKAKEIKEVLNCFFDCTKSSTFGVTSAVGFYRFFEHKNPNKEFAKKYLSDRGLL